VACRLFGNRARGSSDIYEALVATASVDVQQELGVSTRLKFRTSILIDPY
jgi:hypothetical protein